MYKILKKYFSFNDARGNIQGIINSGNWQEMNVITSFKGSKRGGHYHKNTTELFYILEGKIKVYVETPDNQRESFTVEAEDILVIEPLTVHTFEMLTDARWINLLSLKNDETNPDIYKL